MDRVEIVVPRANGEDILSEKVSPISKWLKWSQEAGSQSTFKRPLNCPKNEVHFREKLS